MELFELRLIKLVSLFNILLITLIKEMYEPILGHNFPSFTLYLI